MEERQERMDMDRNEEIPATQVKRWLAAVAVVMILAAGISIAYIYHQQSVVRQLSAHDEQMNATIAELRNQTEGLTAKLNEMTAAQQADLLVFLKSTTGVGAVGNCVLGSFPWRPRPLRRRVVRRPRD